MAELLIRAVLWGLHATDTAIPMLWYWPDLIKAVGLLSHDTDGNDPALAQVLLDNLLKLEVPSTWCVQYPGGYAPAFYRQLHRQGYEIALHFDAFYAKGTDSLVCRGSQPATGLVARHGQDTCDL